MKQPHVLIAGCGDLGCTLGQLLVDAGIAVTGLRRSDTALPFGITTVQADVGNPETLQGLAGLHPDILVYSVAADAQTDENYRTHYVEGLRNVLAALRPANLRHIFFVSSTRVYGQISDQWLDETKPAVPADFGGERLLQAEALLNGLSGTVLRLSGIYGPGRTRLLRLARQPENWPAKNSYSNRIHRDDAAAFIALLIRRVLGEQPVENCYLVTDGCPTSQYEVLSWLAERLGANVGETVIPAAEGGKKLTNKRMLATGFQLQYPDYRAGYAELIRQET